MMMLVFAGWLIYTLKSMLYVSRQIFAVNQQFLFYSSSSYRASVQFKSWFLTQFIIMLPISGYGVIAIIVAIANHYYVPCFCILAYLALLIASSALLYTKLVSRLINTGRQPLLFRLSNNWRKRFFSLFIFHVFDKLKTNYLVTKILSFIIITGIFNLFADVQHDVRVAGIAVLAVATAHSNLIFQEHIFEKQYLSFSRNFPYSYFTRFLNFVMCYFILLLPETVWVFSRFNPFIAVELLLFVLSVTLFLHALLFAIDLNMDKYLQWVLGTFVIMFWVNMFGLLWILIPLNFIIAYIVSYKKYYVNY